MEREAWKTVGDNGISGFLIELACECSDLYRANGGRWNALLSIIEND
jgi:hypothetical protein